MKLANDQVSFSVPRLPALDIIVARLERLSLDPEYAGLRETELARALKPYFAGSRVLAPLAEEVDLATLILYCDVYPETGQLSLIERLRDVVTEHIGPEERIWLDPLKHSYTDLLEVIAFHDGGKLSLRSMGDGTNFLLSPTEACTRLGLGDALLSRVIRRPDRYESGEAVWGGPALVVTEPDARAIMDKTGDWRRNIEMSSGSFALGEWQEFAKRFGHMLLWAYADLRLDSLVDAVTHIQHRTPDGQPYLYSIAVYDHHAYKLIAQGLDAMTELSPAPPLETPSGQPVRRWTEQRSSNGAAVVARVTLTSAQIVVECDGPEQLNVIKHRLARAFGFSLHFRNETVTPPVHQISAEQLTSDQPFMITVTPEEDLLWLKEFLDKAYLEWSDQPHQTLGGLTPRHAFATMREKVTALINEMERSDPGLLRNGRPAFDYNVLRGHVGL